MWQDTAVALCQIAMVPSMMPTVLRSEKPAPTTCVLNAVIMTVIAATQATLRLWFAAITATAIIAIWTTLSAQTLTRRRSSRSTRRHDDPI